MESNRTGLEIAVIGMAGKFPGANNIDQFWNNIRNGVESITFLDDEHLRKVGVKPETYENVNYVKSCGGVIWGKEYFDAHFFNYTASESEAMDPQIRIFHECAWEVLEDAGYDPYLCNERIGLFAGASQDHNWESLCLNKREDVGDFALSFLSNRDFITTQVSYKLGLKGPSVFVQTACSTSLSAISMACWGLLLGQCDIALAGGVSLSSFPKQGYIYQDGMILSPDGHCRPFDEDAKGTIPGEGVGIVALKTLEEAINDGDNIYAVIKGIGINNDGNKKVGFTAPSVLGQSEAVKAALHMSEVDPESIAYIEAHGTGTSLGDPVEFEALKKAFGTDKKQFCAIGSIKSNIGHLDAAAGVVGFIKTALSLKYREIPPSINFNKPNPKIDLGNSPFYVNTTLHKWENDRFPMRAGISSLGIGGTNVHILLEGPPKLIEGQDEEFKLLILSAKSINILDRITENLVMHLKSNLNINMTDVAYTLAVGRKDFEYRKMVVCSTCKDAIELLSKQNTDMSNKNVFIGQKRKIIFMFPGQGSQYTNMGYDLYRNNSTFRSYIDKCFNILENKTGINYKNILYNSNKEFENNLNDTKWAQPILFIFEYSIAKLLMEIGIEPYAMIGHSIGEIVAACISGVLSLEDSIELVVFRGNLMNSLPGGAMLSVPLSENEIKPYLTNLISLAAVNSNKSCVVSGSNNAIELFDNTMKNIGIECIKLHTSHAFHSDMMAPILNDFVNKVSKFKLNNPNIPYISNVTGEWIKESEATDPEYWAQHIKNTVRFSSGVDEFIKTENLVFVEVGPGRVLNTFVKQHKGINNNNCLINLIRHPKEKLSDNYYFLNKIGELWLNGVEIDWKEVYNANKRRRVSLPTYPFEQRSYQAEGNGLKFITNNISKIDNLERENDISKWFYVPAWEQSIIDPHLVTDDYKWVIFANDRCGVSDDIIKQLSKVTSDITIIKNDADIFDKNMKDSEKPIKIIHLWTLENSNDTALELANFDYYQDRGFYSIINIAQAIGKLNISQNVDIVILTNNLLKVLGNENISPEKSTMLGVVKVLPLEFVNMKCKCIDINGFSDNEKNKIYNNLLKDFYELGEENIIAYRGTNRWVQKYIPTKLQEPDPSNMNRIKNMGVYLIIGGFGGMGFTIAEYLAKNHKAKLVLIGRSEFPDRDKWDNWLAEHDDSDEINKKIIKIRTLEENGSEVMCFSADISNLEEMEYVKKSVSGRFGEVNGIIHSGGVIDYGGIILKRNKEAFEKYMNSKVKGTLVLDTLFKDTKLDFMVLFSSLGNIIYKVKFGQAGYNAANEFLESFIDYKMPESNTFVSVINWCDWKEVGMTVNANRIIIDDMQKSDEELIFHNAITPLEGVDVFLRVINNGLHHVSISPIELNSYVSYINKKVLNPLEDNDTEAGIELSDYMISRPNISTQYIEPTDDIERSIAEIFQKTLCLDKVGIEDDFFELGGDSLKAMNIIVFLKQKMDHIITLDMFYNEPTVKGIKKYINNNILNEDLYNESNENNIILIPNEIEHDGLDNKILIDVDPFTDIYYKDCFYNALFTSVMLYRNSILPFLSNEIAIYALAKEDDDFKFTVEFVSEKVDDVVLQEMGIDIDVKFDCYNILNDIKMSLAKGSLVIAAVDCFYEPLRLDTYHKVHWPHTILVHGFDEANKVLNVIEHDDVDSLLYKSIEIGYEDFVECHKGYALNFQSVNACPIFYQISLKDDLLLDNYNNVEYNRIKFKKVILNKKESIKQGIESLTLFRDIICDIASDENLLFKKVEKLMMICNNVIKTKRAEEYRFTKLLDEQSDFIAVINEIIYMWDIIRGIFNKYKTTTIYQNSIKEKVRSRIDDIYNLENRFYIMLLKLLDSR